ncbi:MAG: DUF222 domain-containing protein [Acidimicrobiales bacterium]
MSESTECSARVLAYRSCTPAERQIAIEQLTALECATRAELLDVVMAADLEEDWRADGATAMSASVEATARVASATAKAIVRVGAKLDALPHLREAFASGLLSWDQVVPASTFVTPDTDEDMAQRLQGLSAAQIELLARQHRLRTKREARQAHARRSFRSRPDHEMGGRRYSGFLPDAEAAHVDAVLDRIADSYGPNPETGMWDPLDMRRADALGELATQRLADDADPEICMVVVHADAAVVDGLRDGNGSIDGMQIPTESVLRHLCDARIEYSVDAPDGTTVGIGRTSRVPPRWLRRRIRQRDGCLCRFPGCNRRSQQIHHIRHWTRDSGPTDAQNLAGLCWHHHRLVHEGGWEITGNADDELTFTSPYGRELRSKPEPLRDAIRVRAEQAIALPLRGA